MSRPPRGLAALLLLAGFPAVSGAQAVPEEAPAARVSSSLRRTPSFRIDPFRHIYIPHWGFVFSAGGRAENNTLNLADIGAFIVLGDRDEILIGDIIDAFGLVPRGAGLGGQGEGEGGVYVGGPIGGRLRLGVSAQNRGYGAFRLDDDAVALLRDGNAGRTEFSLGETRGSALATVDAGLHGMARFGPLGTVDGVHVTVGAGVRYVRPIAYARQRSLIANGGRVQVSGDSVNANLDIETVVAEPDWSQLFEHGSGFAADLLVRLEWPTNGLAIEAMLANLGTVTVEGVERRRLTVDVATTSLDTVVDVLDTLDLQFQDSISVDVTLPRLVRFGASAWANRILQLDLAATMPITGEFASPLSVDVGTTWRLVGGVPLRLGLVLGGHQGVGYNAGVAIEGRHFLFRVAGESLGGLFSEATGAGGRLEIGTFF